MAKRYSAEQWAAWVAEERESALSVRDFCDWIGVSQNAFYLQVYTSTIWHAACLTRGVSSLFAGELFAVGTIAAFIVAVGIVTKPRTFTVAHLQ